MIKFKTGDKVFCKNFAYNSAKSVIWIVKAVHNETAFIVPANPKEELAGYTARARAVSFSELSPGPTVNESLAMYAFSNGDKLEFNYRKPGDKKNVKHLVTVNSFYDKVSDEEFISGIRTYDHTRGDYRSFRFSRIQGGVKVVPASRFEEEGQ